MLSLTRSDERGIELDVDGDRRSFSWTWLRDHARDDGSFDAATQQRLVPPSVVASAGRAHVEIDDAGALTVSWPDGTAAWFGRDFLRTIADPTTSVRVGCDAVPWTGDELRGRLLRVGADALATDAGVRETLDALWRDGVVTLHDVALDRAGTRRVVERFGYVRTTIFGDMWEVSSDGGFDDTASTSLEITPHTDGTYSHDAPGLLALHCLRYDATGGDNVFVDAHALVDRLSTDALDVLRRVEIPGQYIGDGVHLMACRPALRFHGDRLAQVSYNHHDRAPFTLPEPEMTRLYAALHEFDRLASHPDLQFDLALRPGDMVLIDNWRILHGRRAFTGERLIAGGYVNREDVESTTRRLRST